MNFDGRRVKHAWEKDAGAALRCVANHFSCVSLELGVFPVLYGFESNQLEFLDSRCHLRRYSDNDTLAIIDRIKARFDGAVLIDFAPISGDTAHCFILTTPQDWTLRPREFLRKFGFIKSNHS